MEAAQEGPEAEAAPTVVQGGVLGAFVGVLRRRQGGQRPGRRSRINDNQSVKEVELDLFNFLFFSFL